jgi:hypothetical protein
MHLRGSTSPNPTKALVFCPAGGRRVRGGQVPPHATVGVGGGAPCYKQGGVPFLPHPRQGLLMVILQLACPQATCPPSTFASGQRSDPHANGSGGKTYPKQCRNINSHKYTSIYIDMQWWLPKTRRCERYTNIYAYIFNLTRGTGSD